MFKKPRFKAIFQGITLSFVLVFLVACAHKPSHLSADGHGYDCDAGCRAALTTCNQECQNSCQLCKKHTQRMTDRRYRIYVARQKAQGLPVIQMRDAYKDPLRCKKVTCDCASDYDICKQLCTGKVTPVLKHEACILDRSIWAW